MINFNDLSIRKKMIAIIVLTCSVILFVGFGILIVNEIITSKEELLERSMVEARFIGEYCVVYLSFNDKDGAEKILKNVESIPTILVVRIYDANNILFSEFKRPDQEIFITELKTETFSEFAKDHLHIFQPIFYDNQFYGTIYLKVSTEELNKSITNFVVLMIGLIIILVVLSYFAASKLQSIISGPILDLANATKKISKEADYSLKMKKKCDDEVGTLYDGFNNMLEQIHTREKERKQAEEFLRKSESFLKQIIESMSNGFSILDENGVHIDANLALCKMTGFAKEELIGVGPPHPYWPEEEYESIQKAFVKISQGIFESFEFIFKNKNGKRFPVLVNPSEIKDKEGHVVCNFATVMDITERKQAEEALRTSQNFLDNIIEHSPHAMWISDASGTLIRLNEACRNLLHITNDEVVGKYNILKDTIVIEQGNLPLVKKVFEENKIARFSLEYDTTQLKSLKLRDKTSLSLDVTISPVLNTEGKVINAIIQHIDITERVIFEKKQTLTTKILSILNRPNEWQQLVKDILEEIKKFTDFEAVGIRLKEGEDFPYFETNGFPSHFVNMERYLCIKDSNGKIIRDSEKKPILECMCGNVISGRTDQSLSFFTERGSFWSNNTTELLTSTSEEDRQSHTRNRCNGEGYESVALVPIHSGNERIGLLQFNDKRPNRFTLNLIEFFEEIGLTIGIAFNRMQSEKKIKESEERFRSLFEQAAIGVAQIESKTGKYIRVNEKYCSLLGYSKNELLTLDSKELVHPEDLSLELESIKKLYQGEIKDFTLEERYIHKSGLVTWINLTVSPLWTNGLKHDYYIAVIEDITEQRKATELIKASLQEKEILLREIHHRVKNNMQIISSLLKLQINYVDNKEVIAAFEDSNFRIRSMSLVHEKLYGSHNLSRIDFKEYIQTLTNELARANNVDISKIQVDVTDIAAVSLDIDNAIPCGLLINELVSNAFKYAFPGYKNWKDSKKGVIKIILCTTGLDDIELEVSDNGVGLPEDFNMLESKTLGLHLVSILVENQLKGRLEVSSENGAKFKIKFKEKTNG